MKVHVIFHITTSTPSPTNQSVSSPRPPPAPLEEDERTTPFGFPGCVVVLLFPNSSIIFPLALFFFPPLPLPLPPFPFPPPPPPPLSRSSSRRPFDIHLITSKFLAFSMPPSGHNQHNTLCHNQSKTTIQTTNNRNDQCIAFQYFIKRPRTPNTGALLILSYTRTVLRATECHE